mgnify:CR=1 FL=1
MPQTEPPVPEADAPSKASLSAVPDPARPGAVGSLTWTLWLDQARTGAEHMAWDHTLALALPPGRGVVRLYRWLRPTLSLGRHEPARGVIDGSRLAAAGVELAGALRAEADAIAILLWAIETNGGVA